MQIVLPTYFIIAIVYLNLWMKPDGSPGRFLLTILTFICLVTIYNSNRDKLPALAYANVSSSLKPFFSFASRLHAAFEIVLMVALGSNGIELAMTP